MRLQNLYRRMSRASRLRSAVGADIGHVVAAELDDPQACLRRFANRPRQGSEAVEVQAPATGQPDVSVALVDQGGLETG